MVTVHRAGDIRTSPRNSTGRSPVTVTDLVEEVKGPEVTKTSSPLTTIGRSPVTVTDLGTGEEITLPKVNAYVSIQEGAPPKFPAEPMVTVACSGEALK